MHRSRFSIDVRISSARPTSLFSVETYILQLKGNGEIHLPWRVHQGSCFYYHLNLEVSSLQLLQFQQPIEWHFGLLFVVCSA
jgi:hypothetical protein